MWRLASCRSSGTIALRITRPPRTRCSSMAHPLKHAESSARKFGGKAEDYLPIHNWLAVMWTLDDSFLRIEINRSSRSCGNVGIPKGFPRAEGRVGSRLLAFHAFLSPSFPQLSSILRFTFFVFCFFGS